MKTSFALLITLTVIACELPSSKETSTENNPKTESKYRRMVGDIIHDELIDPSPFNFKPCEDYYSFQYYNFESNGLQYKGEKPALERAILSQYVAAQEPLESGYITVRFLVNCEGRTGWFRVFEIDSEYQEKKFEHNTASQLKKIVAGLNGWRLKSFKNKAKDYHQYLTFKIVDNQITSILP